ncbi:MAG TPA: twin-arginine translocase TatA/TatE family subunit [Candidatus Limnocylindria bacterium]|nr:twin-arginine translocase TatA/TatE family subunit [Candidatus Limnocylindria bacterium]
MFGIGTGELLLLLFLALLVLGPERMPRLARDIGKTVGDLRRTSEELRQEFLNADALIEKAASLPERTAPQGAPAPALTDVVEEPPALPGGAADEASAPPDAGATQAAAVTGDHEETAFDRDARLARERLESPEHQARAQAEGWIAPTDKGGNDTDRWG